MLLIIIIHLSGIFYVEKPLQSIVYSPLLQSCEVDHCYSHFIAMGLTEWKRMAYWWSEADLECEPVSGPAFHVVDCISWRWSPCLLLRSSG